MTTSFEELKKTNVFFVSLTSALSIDQEVKNNMAANIPTLAIYVDYQKAYDRV